ncbi:MAG TPA: hypothetical protein VIM53_00935 [Candidatus Saccharimonadales bacterium]
MPEFSSSPRHHNRAPRGRQYLGVALSGVVFFAASNGGGLSGCTSSAKHAVDKVQSAANKPVPGGGNVSQEMPVIMSENPATKAPLVLDCVDYYEQNGKKTTSSALQGPRALIFESNISLFAAKLVVEYGHVILDKNGNAETSSVDTHGYWVAEDHTEDPATTSYGSGNGSLPEQQKEWESRLKFAPELAEKGTQLPVVGTNPDGDGSQVVVGRISPYFNEDFDGQVEQTTIHDPGWLAVECRAAKDNMPKSPAAIPANLALTIHVPDSPVVEHSPKT